MLSKSDLAANKKKQKFSYVTNLQIGVWMVFADFHAKIEKLFEERRAKMKKDNSHSS